MKIKSLSLAISFFIAGNAFATENITLDMYRQLLPKNTAGQVDYDLHLSDKLSLPYHCNIKKDNEGRFEIDLGSCEHYSLDWKKERAGLVNLSLSGDPSGEKITEHKLWAMAFAQAYVSTMIQMQYGLGKENGTFDLHRPFGSGESFGNYFSRNMGPNYFVSKGLQESSLGRDLPAPADEGDDGVLQIEYPGSAWSELQGSGGGGFPRIFGTMQPKKILDSFSGPARNIIGSAVTSGFYNGSVIGINTGSLPWDKDKTGTQVRIHEFIQGSQDKDALSMVMSYMYNRGPYSVKELLLKSEQSFNHCMAQQDHLESDPACFVQLNDFGTRYIRQIPYVTQLLNEAGKKPEHHYDTDLNRRDISNYIDLLARYGFYSKKEIEKAKPAAMTRFDEMQKNGSISYAHDFGKVLETLMVQLPVTQFSEKSAIDESLISTLTNADEKRLFLSVADNVGTIISHDWLEPGHKIALMPGSKVQQAVYENAAGHDCATAIQDQIEGMGGNGPAHLTLKMMDGQCQVNQVSEEEAQKPVAVAGDNFTVLARNVSAGYELNGLASQNAETFKWTIVKGQKHFWLQEAEGSEWVSEINQPKARALIPANTTGEVTYRLTVTNKNGQTDTSDITVTVKDEHAKPDEAAWDSRTTYDKPCQKVTYNGSSWMNGWWTQGEAPGSDGEHGVWRKAGSDNMHGACKK